jgi:hypothetical protein
MKSHHTQIKVFPMEIVEQGLELVQTAHRLHLKNQVHVFHKKSRHYAGCYAKPGIYIDSASSQPPFTFIHELGHHLDYEELGSTFGQPCSTERGSSLFRLVKIMRTTKAYQEIRAANHLSKYRRRYYSSAIELWAKAYTQFVIRRCINAGVVLDTMPNLAFKWEDEDFDPIYKEIMAIFSANGWV